MTFYDDIGGEATFRTLVERFYAGVRTDELLWPMYPADDLDGAIHRLATFLAQYWGGPSTYSAERGHPRLRMRHAPFPVTPSAREAWLAHMSAAVRSLGLAPLQEATLLDYLERAAHAMVNTPEPGGEARAAASGIPLAPVTAHPPVPARTTSPTPTPTRSTP